MVLEDKVFEPKRAKNEGRPTWIPEPRTAEYYKELQIDYFEDSREITNRKNLQKCSYEYDRKVKTVYRIRTNDRKEWLTWFELRTGKTQLGSPIAGWMVYVGLNWKPIPTYEVVFDNETQQQVKKISGMVQRQKEYAVEFNETNLTDLLLDGNEFETQYIIMHEDRDKYHIDLLEHFKSDFDPLYTKMQQRRVEISNADAKKK